MMDLLYIDVALGKLVVTNRETFWVSGEFYPYPSASELEVIIDNNSFISIDIGTCSAYNKNRCFNTYVIKLLIWIKEDFICHRKQNFHGMKLFKLDWIL